MLQKPDIIDTLIDEGAELKKKGKYYWTRCLLHTEKTPSFKVDPEKQSFYCFGCHEHGDVITFIKKYKDLSFKEALLYLGVDRSKKFKPDQREVRKRELIREYRQWLNSYTNFLCNVLRKLDQAKLKVETMKIVEAMSWLYHSEPTWEAHLDILFYGNEQEKFELYKRIRHGR